MASRRWQTFDQSQGGGSQFAAPNATGPPRIMPAARLCGPGGGLAGGTSGPAGMGMAGAWVAEPSVTGPASEPIGWAPNWPELD